MPTNNLIRQLPMAGRANFLPYQIGPDGKPHWALPAVLAGAANAVTAPYRAMNPEAYPEFNQEEEAANLALNMLGGGGVVGRAPKNALGMNVWHGSPHKFEPTELNDLGEFNAAKIGSGEGEQAYGHGLYLAEHPDVAKGYSPRDLDYEASLLNMYKRAEASRNYEAMEVIENAMLHKTPAELAQMHPTQTNIVKQIKKIPNKSNLYKVDLPDEHIAKMLDWDKPLSQQHPDVQKAVAQFKTANIPAEGLDMGGGGKII